MATESHGEGLLASAERLDKALDHLESAVRILTGRMRASGKLEEEAHRLSADRARLAVELQDIRARGYAREHGENSPHSCCIAAPLVWLLDVSGRTVLRLLGQADEGGAKVTDEEIASLIAEAESHGVVESDERKMIAGVMRLADRSVRAIMTPRTEVAWIDLDASRADIRKRLLETSYSMLPAGKGSVDHMVGVVRTREALVALLGRQAFDLAALVRTAPIVHDNADALDVLATLKEAEVPMALVHDEYGDFEGVVTPADILETIVGVFRSDVDEDEPAAVERDDGSWLLAGYLPIDEMADTLGIPLPEKRDYETLAGFVLSHMHHLPQVGEHVDVMGWRFEVMDLDGRRIDKVLASRSIKTHREART